jgi:EAL domain-containing protein (putative c-di-GMP-specific phosphodiesterase class I)
VQTPEDFNERKVAEAIEMIKLEAELRSAMRNNEFRLHYQPIHDLRSQKISGLEALIRWKSPTRGEIMPAAFMPLAEATSLVVPIGNWVIDAGLKDFLDFRDAAGDHLTLSFNLARRQMESAEFLPFLSESVLARGISPTSIKLEMLERNLFSQKWFQAGFKTAPHVASAFCSTTSAPGIQVCNICRNTSPQR